MERNIAVIGCGYWGKNLVRNFYEVGALHTICDVAEDRLKSIQKTMPDLAIAFDYRQVLKNPKIEAIVIATPAVTHYQVVLEALQADKDVFVEKPLALSYKEGAKLVNLAEEKKKILMVGHLLLYHPAIIKLKEIVNNGDLGNIKYIYSNRLNLGKFRTEENILWSFAPHDISVVLDLLGEMPVKLSAHGANYLEPHIADVTVTAMSFPSGVKAHLFVSWLHPFKEQKLVVIGGRKMAAFDNIQAKGELYLYNHKIDWIERMPVPRPENAQAVEFDSKEPLRAECEHFIECLASRKRPKTDGQSGLRVLKILEACQESLRGDGKVCRLVKEEKDYSVHESAFVDEKVEVGEGTKIWHFSHVLKNSIIGRHCSLGQNVMVGPNVSIGNNVKIQNNVSIYDGVILEDDVFCGPSMVFTNVINPRSHWPRKDEYRKTLVKRGASLGANSTIICGHNIGKYAFVGAGAVVSRDVPDYGLVTGVPGRLQGWMCYCGIKLGLSVSPDSTESAKCSECGRKYQKEGLAVREID